jgi:hypothetical protein
MMQEEKNIKRKLRLDLETDYERQQRLAREETIKEHEEKYYRELTKVTKE